MIIGHRESEYSFLLFLRTTKEQGYLLQSEWSSLSGVIAALGGQWMMVVDFDM